MTEKLGGGQRQRAEMAGKLKFKREPNVILEDSGTRKPIKRGE